MKNNNLRRLALSVGIASALGTWSIAASAAPPWEKKRAFGLGNPVTLDKLPAGRLKNRLKSLRPKAQERAKAWLNRIHFHERDLEFMRTDDEGAVFFADTKLPDITASYTPPATIAQVLPQDGTVDVFKLHSKPGASNVVFLDFDGHTITGTAWNSYVGTTVLDAVPYDQDGNPTAFSEAEQINIAEIWRRIAEDYAPFDIDVTTEQPANFGPTVGHLLMTNDIDANGNAMPAQGAGGVAYVNVWGLGNYHTAYSPALVYASNLVGGRPDFVSEAASHELGHNMGLSHDATSTAGYYNGHGTGFVSWGPIMGTGYNRNVSQWSQGDYTDATQLQDDVAIIANKVTYRTDDHGDTIADATPLVVDGDGNVLATTRVDDPDNLTPANKGIVGRRSDVDMFSFATTGGAVSLLMTPSWEARYTRGSNLDASLSLYDQFGELMVSNDPADDTDASIDMMLAPGTYYVSVTGESSENYNDYGSLGYYRITGTLPQASDSNPPQPNPMSWSAVPAANDHASITMTAVTAIDDTSTVEYFFTCGSANVACQSSGWQSSPTYTATSLNAETTYNFTVKARDAFGNETNESVDASATTSTAPDTEAPQPNPMGWSNAPNATDHQSITMTAVTATDDTSTVEYFFACSATGAACQDSGWQSSPTYALTGLDAETTYSFTVKARDAAGNETAASASASATTPAAPDTEAPQPNPMGWSSAPNATDHQSITMTAVTATDDTSTVEYFFACSATGAACQDSGWQSSPTYALTGLDAETTYSFTVKARDAAGNETAASASASATTPAAPDTEAPQPNPMGWSNAPNATDHQSITMTAVTATDDTSTVEYFFACSATGAACQDSGWQSSPTYALTGLDAETTYSFTVKARDAAGNETAASASASATTPAAPDTEAPQPNPMGWSSAPNATDHQSVTMTAVTATDDTSTVEYFFACSATGAACQDSGWQSSPTYALTGLDAETTYSFTVKARDAAGNETAASASASATTPAAPDTEAPQPNPMGWSSAPNATDHQSITMTAVTATDDTSTVEYFFACSATGAACQDSGWQSSPTYALTGLDAETTYSFTVKARDVAGNETAASASASATTPAAPVSNEAPFAVKDVMRTRVNKVITIPVLANDTDPDGDTLNLVSVAPANKGTVVMDGNQLIYTAGNESGRDRFKYTITDGNGHTVQGIVVVRIKPNKAPRAVKDRVETTLGQTIMIPVLDNDTDVDGDTISLVSVDPATKGTVTVDGSQLVYTAGNTRGRDRFQYTITDGKGHTKKGWVVVRIRRQ